MLRCALGGFAIAAGYNAKEIVALFLPAMMLVILIVHFRSLRTWWAISSLAVGAGLWLMIEAIVLWSWTGDWLFHAHAVAASQRGYAAPPIYPSFGGYLDYFTDYVRWLVDPRQDFGFAGPLMVAGCVWVFWKRSGITWLLLAVVAIPLFYLTVGTTDLADYRPIVHQQRYLVPLVPGMAILAAAMLMDLWRARLRRCRGRMTRRLMLAGAVAMLLSTLVLPNRHAGRWYHAATWQAAYELFNRDDKPAFQMEETGILASHFSANRLDPLNHWLEMPEVRRLLPPLPVSPEEWVQRYAGQLVCVTAIDRQRPSKTRHANLTLFGPAIESLAGFPRIAQAAPPRDRLGELKALVLNHPVPADPAFRVEMYRIPETLPND